MGNDFSGHSAMNNGRDTFFWAFSLSESRRQNLQHNLELWRVINWFNFSIMFLNCKLPCLNLWDYWKTFLINIKMGGSEVDGMFKADQLAVWSLALLWPWPLVTWNSEWRHPDTGHTLCNNLVMDQTLVAQLRFELATSMGTQIVSKCVGWAKL